MNTITTNVADLVTKVGADTVAAELPILVDAGIAVASPAPVVDLHVRTGEPVAGPKEGPSPAPVAPRMSNGDAKPDASVATNVEAVQAAWLKAQAVWFDAQVSELASKVGATITEYMEFIATADDRKVWRTLGYRSLRMWLFAVLGDTLTTWDSASQKALVRLLTDRGLSGTDVAALTGTSEATVSRAVAGKPKAESTATDRAVKSLESVAGKCGDVDRYSTADLKRLHAELLRTVSLVGDELAKRSGTTLPRSGATGTTSTGVNVAPKPSPKPGK